ncbi:dual specificity protein phosphatase family protein [Candidatus Babeliales bacterium]|nr:dual specificity protein phosphatase family protein [Candidatus Babeliales bacterium]
MNKKQRQYVLCFLLLFFINNHAFTAATNPLDNLKGGLTALKAKLGQLGQALTDLREKQELEKNLKEAARKAKEQALWGQYNTGFTKAQEFVKSKKPLRQYVKDLKAQEQQEESLTGKIWGAFKGMFWESDEEEEKNPDAAAFIAYDTAPFRDIDKELSQLIASLIAAIAPHDKEALRVFAEVQGYGYKTGNLQELEKISRALSILTNLIADKTGSYELKIRVPEFKGISSDSIKAFLLKNGFDIKTRWADFIARFDKAAQDQFKRDQNFSKTFLDNLKVLENDVMAIFNTAATEPDVVSGIFDFDAQFEVGINETLEKIKRFKSSLMVRSTGKEDTDKLANAGGNESVANVAPQLSEILLAMGVVVGSYFSEKSFMQRLIGGDPELFDEPFTPVLIQRMVGERIRGIRSKNVRSAFNKPGPNLFEKWDTFKTTSKNSLDAFFNTQESDLDGMLKAAQKGGWQVKVSLTNGTNFQNVAPTPEAIVLAVRVLTAASVANPNNYVAVQIEPVLPDNKMIERRLPACGVMFTEEPGGGIAKKDLLNEHWDYSVKARSTGIVAIDAAYGHNEGVVNSLVGVDTYYLSDFDKMYAIVRPKPFRKFPSLNQDSKLEDRDNPPDLAMSPVLTSYEGLMLKLLANVLEEYYLKPMDVEFVIDRNDSTLYLVQARPITHNPNQGEPSYIANPAALTGEVFKGETIIPADGAVRLIDGNQIIVKSTMGEAFDTYMHSKTKERVACVVVGQHAPPTSHEGTQFRTAVKPVIFMTGINKLIDAISEPGAKFLVDPQQGLVVQWDSKQTLQDLKNTNDILEGWKNYPISPLLSSIAPADFDATKVDDLLKELELELKEGVSAAELQAFLAPFKSTKNQAALAPQIMTMLDTVAQGADEKNLRISFLVLLMVIKQRMEFYVKSITLDQDLTNKIALFKYTLAKVGHHILQTRNFVKGTDDYIKRLFAVRFLEALLFQQPEADQVLNAFSLANFVLRTLKPEAIAIQRLKEKGLVEPEIKQEGKVIQYAKIADEALNQVVSDKWIQFVAKVGDVGGKQHKKDFGEAVATLGKLGLLTVWLHTDFFEPAKEKDLTQALPVQQVLISLVTAFNNDKALLNTVNEKIARVKFLKPEIFAQRKKFDKQWLLLTGIVTELIDPAFVQSYKNAGDIGKVAVLSLLDLFIDTFDQSIKAVKASSEYEVVTSAANPKLNTRDNKLFTFKTMLDEYLRLLTGISPYQELGGHYGTAFDTGVTVKLAAATTSLSGAAKLYDAAQLDNSNNFNVALVVIGNKAGGSLQAVNTFEDIFTFIHQSLINVTSFFLGKTSVVALASKDAPALPQLLKDLLAEIDSIKKVGFGTHGNHATLMGLSFSKGTLGYKYNYPLRSHSATLFLEYNKKTDTARFGCRTSGENEWGRFYKIGDYAQAVAWALDLKQVEVTPEKKAVTFWWTVTKEDIARFKLAPYLPTINILAKAMRQANDGPTGHNGLSYATDGSDSMITKENTTYTFIVDNLLKTLALKESFAKKIIEKSLSEKSYPHMYLDRVLEYIPAGTAGDKYWKGTLAIMDKLLSKTSYAANADIFFFRGNRSPAYPHDVPADEYYGISEENIYQTLARRENDHHARQMDNLRGIGSFKHAIAQQIFNTIVTKTYYSKFSADIWTDFVNLIKKRPDFFASLKSVNSSGGLGGSPYSTVANTNLQTFLQQAQQPGRAGAAQVKEAAQAVVVYDQLMNLNAAGSSVASFVGPAGAKLAGTDTEIQNSKKKFFDENMELVLSGQNGVQVFKAFYPLATSVNEVTKDKLWDEFNAQIYGNQLVLKNVIELLEFCDAVNLQARLKELLEGNNFSWIDDSPHRVGGMALPYSFAYIKALQFEGVKNLVSLTNETQLPQEWFTSALGVPGWSTLRNVRIPIQDFAPPTLAQIKQFITLASVEANQPLVVHCAGGYGRTGTMLACWLVKSKNITAQEAIDEVRLKRPHSIETEEQENSIKAYKVDLDTPPPPSPWTYYNSGASAPGDLYPTKPALLADLSSHFADNNAPGATPEQRQNLQRVFDSVPVLLDSPDEVFARLQTSGSLRRLSLILVHILLQAGYKNDVFLQNYAVQYTSVSSANNGDNYSYLAQKNYDLLVKNIQNKIYTQAQAQLLENARKPFINQTLKGGQLKNVLDSSYHGLI